MKLKEADYIWSTLYIIWLLFISKYIYNMHNLVG